MQNSPNKIIILGTLFLILGISILTSNYYNEKVTIAYSYMNELLLKENQQEIYEMQEEVVNLQEESTISSFEDTENIKEEVPVADPYLSYYVGYLEIPKINLKRGFTAIDSSYNTVNKNIQVVKNSNYPDVKNGNLILAAHSGSSYLSFFKNLYKLNVSDYAYITYNNFKYTYKVVDIYQQEKTGKIAIYRNLDKNTLTLVTCTKDSKTKQTIYILELESINNI